ncbi:glycosyltransferase family A protein [Humidisolicoccus flavus]|uniref:glycosyltransferase family A protein n=1 Tax=Humidisolicoccus flavus TaxID=3111414 RepID=UPI00324856FA
MIPVKDDGELLRRCLEALKMQTRQPDEVIVVDNQSSDDSAEIARASGARVVECATPGIPAASATGYDAAIGNCILRLDADCIPGRQWVEVMAEAFEAQPDVAAFTGGARFIDGPRRLQRPLAAAYLGVYAIVTAPALGHAPLFGSNLGIRRSAWRAVRHRLHLAPNVHDDLDLAYHLGERHRIRVLANAEMGISMRPFFTARGFARRTEWGARTVIRHWPQDFPTVRWLKLAMLRQRFGSPASSKRRP